MTEFSFFLTKFEHSFEDSKESSNFEMKGKFHFRGGVFPDTALLTKL